MKMRWRITLAVFAISICSFGCRSEGDETVPDELIGIWTTSTTSYENNAFELNKDIIVFRFGPSESAINNIFKVHTVRQSDTNTSVITIYYTDHEGNAGEASILYDGTRPGSIRFKNQPGIEWKLVAPRPANKVVHPPRRPPGSGSEHSGLVIALALLGVALTSVGTVWRWRESRAKKSAATVPKVDAEPVRQPEGDHESSKASAAKEVAERPQSPDLVPSIAVEEQRRSERILLKIPVRVAGVNTHGRYFEERTSTLSINRHGAFISLGNSPREGEHVFVTNLGTLRTCAFRVCESGKDSTGEVTAWGIECLEPDANFWQIRFPDPVSEPSAQKNITALIVCSSCHSREVAELSVAEYRSMRESDSMKRDCLDCGASTAWKFILVDASAEAGSGGNPAIRLPSGEEGRQEKRIVAKLPIRLRHLEGGQTESAVTENVSRSGVCCTAKMEFNVGDAILLKFESGTGPTGDEYPARIRWRRSMGKNRKTLYGIMIERKEL